MPSTFIDKCDIYEVFTNFVSANPSSKTVIEELWRHILIHKINKKRNRDNEKSIPITPEMLRGFIEYSLQPIPTFEEIDANIRTNLERDLISFDGFK